MARGNAARAPGAAGVRGDRDPPGQQSMTAPSTPADVHIGEPFDPRPDKCGFYPEDVVDRQKGLGDGPKRVYRRLRGFYGPDGCFPSQATLACELGRSEREVWEDLHELEHWELLAIRRRGHWQGGHRANRYEFLWHSMFQSEPQTVAGHSSPVSRKVSRNPAKVSRKKRPSEPQTVAEESYESSSENPRLNPAPPPSGVGVAPARSPAAADDEETWKDPDAELLRRLEGRHGNGTDCLKLKQLIREKLDPWEPLGVTLRDFLELDQAQTRGRIQNPGGYYTALAGSVVAKARGRLVNNPQKLQRAVNEAARRKGWL